MSRGGRDHDGSFPNMKWGNSRVPTVAIQFALKTGIGWKDLPSEAFGVSYTICLRRIAQCNHSSRVKCGILALQNCLGAHL